jgi:hypothetical protein
MSGIWLAAGRSPCWSVSAQDALQAVSQCTVDHATLVGQQLMLVLVGDAVFCYILRYMLYCSVIRAHGCQAIAAAPQPTPWPCCRLAASAKGVRGQPAEAAGSIAAADLLELLATGACVDEHLADQLIIFMALAKGRWALGILHVCWCTS